MGDSYQVRLGDGPLLSFEESKKVFAEPASVPYLPALAGPIQDTPARAPAKKKDCKGCPDEKKAASAMEKPRIVVAERGSPPVEKDNDEETAEE